MPAQPCGDLVRAQFFLCLSCVWSLLPIPFEYECRRSGHDDLGRVIGPAYPQVAAGQRDVAPRDRRVRAASGSRPPRRRRCRRPGFRPRRVRTRAGAGGRARRPGRNRCWPIAGKRCWTAAPDRARRPARRRYRSTSINACGLPIDTAPKSHGLAIEFDRIAILDRGESRQRDLRRIELRHAHGDGITVVTQPHHVVGGQRAVDAETIAPGDAVAHQPGGHATRAVAALLRRRTVGIPDAVGSDRILAARRLDGQDLVAADAEVAVGQSRSQRRIRRRRAVAQVDDDEIVAGAVHLARSAARRQAPACGSVILSAGVAGSSTASSALSSSAGVAGRPSICGVLSRRLVRWRLDRRGFSGRISGPLAPQPASEDRRRGRRVRYAGDLFMAGV